MKDENAKDWLKESLGELNESQEIKKRVQKVKETQPEASQAKIGEDVLEHERGNLGICEDTREEKEVKAGENEEKDREE